MHLDMSFDPSAPIPCTWQQHRNRSNNYISCPWDHQLIQLLEEILNVGDGPGIACSVLHVNVSSENAGHHNLLIGEVAQLLLWTELTQQWQQAQKTWQLTTMPHKKVHAVLAMFSATIQPQSRLQAVLQSLGSLSLFGFAPIC